MKKKFLAVMMAITCTLSLAACGGDTPDEGSSAPGKSGAESKSEGGTNEGGSAEEGNADGDSSGTASALPDSLENADLVIVWDTTEEAWNNTL